MAEPQQENVVFLDDKEIKVADLSDEQITPTSETKTIGG